MIAKRIIKGRQMPGATSKDQAIVMRNLREALIKSMGYRDEDLERPFVAVVHGWNEVSPGHFHLKQVAHYAKASVKAAGGTPAEIIVPGICGSMSGGGGDAFKYNVAYRDFAAALVEIMINLNQCDAAVLIPTCDHVIPAYLMGAALTNVPSIIVTGGYMEPGTFKGECVTMVDTAKKYEEYKKGKLTEAELKELIDSACPGPGACPEMATAHTMAAVSEALGMSLPGNTAVAATSADLIRIAQEAGKKVMDLFNQGIRPSDIITKEAYENAIRVVLAVGGSPNALVHLPAIMRNANITDISWEDWDRLSKITPFICSVLPNTRKFTLKDLDKAGRIRAVMKELEPLLNLGVMTVTGKTLRENLRGVKVKDRRVIKSLDSPCSEDGGLVVLKGNLAPEGAIVKKSAVPPEMFEFGGKAKVFNCEEEATEALSEGRIHPGDVVVVRYEGPKGSPGGKKVYLPMHKIVGMGLIDSVAFITDGALSGTNLGLAIAYVSPEAASGGSLAVLQDGDKVEIDIPNRRLEVKLSNQELKQRLSQWRAPEPKVKMGALGLFARSAESYAKGAYVF